MKRALLATALAITTCFAAFGQQASGLVIFSNAGTTGAKTAVNSVAKVKTYQAWGATSTGTGSAVVAVQGSNNGGLSWDTIGTITLTLGTTVTSDSFTSYDRYPQVRGNVTTLTGTGAVVSLVMGQ